MFINLFESTEVHVELSEIGVVLGDLYNNTKSITTCCGARWSFWGAFCFFWYLVLGLNAWACCAAGGGCAGFGGLLLAL